jgi:hypothetical protein
MRLLRFIAILAIVAAIGVDAARAGSIREQQSDAVWRKQDECARTALLKFPDHTPESNADRDRATRDCERKNHVPVRAPATESPVKTIPDGAAD